MHIWIKVANCGFASTPYLVAQADAKKVEVLSSWNFGAKQYWQSSNQTRWSWYKFEGRQRSQKRRDQLVSDQNGEDESSIAAWWGPFRDTCASEDRSIITEERRQVSQREQSTSLSRHSHMRMHACLETRGDNIPRGTLLPLEDSSMVQQQASESQVPHHYKS